MHGVIVGPGQRRHALQRPLPSLPLTTGATVMLLGHSFVGNGGFTGSNDNVSLPLINITSRTTGELPWLRGLDSRFNLDAWPDVNVPYKAGYGLTNLINGASQGLSGTTLQQILPALPYMIGRRPDLVCFSFGINDVSLPGMTLAAMIANYDAALKMFRASGIWVVADTIAPVTAARIGDGDPRLAMIAGFNSWLKGQQTAGREGLKVFDTEAVLGIGRPSQSFWLQSDGLHPQDRGVFALASARLDILRPMVAAGDYRDHNPANGNAMPNATYAGTAGTKGAGVTGSVASNCDASLTTGVSTVVASKEASDVVGYDKQVLTITPVADASPVHRLSLKQTANVTLASRGLAVGDWLVAMQYLELSAWDFWVRATWSIYLSAGTLTKWTTTMARSGLNTGVQVLPTGGYGIWMESDNFQIPDGQAIDTLRVGGGVTNSMLNLEWLGAGSGPGICKVSKPILRKTGDPRPRWNL